MQLGKGFCIKIRFFDIYVFKRAKLLVNKNKLSKILKRGWPIVVTYLCGGAYGDVDGDGPLLLLPVYPPVVHWDPLLPPLE